MRKKSRKLRSVISSLVIFALITMMIPVGVFAEEAEAVPVEEVIVAEEVTEEAAPVAVEEEASEELVALQAEMEVAALARDIEVTLGYYEGREYRVMYTTDVAGSTYTDALNAAKIAEAVDGGAMNLVSITSLSEEQFIEGLLTEDGEDIIVDAWIGLANEKNNTNDWKWADGSAYGYKNFAGGQETGKAATFVKSKESPAFNNKWLAKADGVKANAYILESKEAVATQTLLLSEKEIKVGLGESKTLTAKNFPENSTLPEGAKGLKWTIECADSAIDVNDYATVVDGKVTVTRTLPTITDPIYVVARVVDKDGNLLPSEDKRIEGACVLKNTDAPAPAVEIKFTNAKESYVLGDANKTLIATATGTTDTIRYTSSDPAIVSIGGVTGQLDLNKAGTVTITATVAGKTATCEVTVTEKPIIVTGIKITKDGEDVGTETQVIDKGAQQQYGALVTAAGTTVTDRNVTWTSSDPALVSVDATGLVKGKVKDGGAWIIATVKTGTDDEDPTEIKEAKMYVSVTEPVAPVEPVATTYFNNNEYQLFDATVAGGYSDALAAALALNGHLVTIGSVEEQDAVASLARQGNQEYYWMGGTVDKSVTPFIPEWNTGEPFSYEEDWAAGEPNKVVEDAFIVMGRSGAGWYTFDGATQNRQNVGYIVEIEDAQKPEAPQVKYDTHVQDIGWLASVKQPDPSGTVGLHKRMEAFKVTLEGAPAGLGLEYRTHIENSGWEDGYTQSPNMSGTEGNSLRMEALQLRLSGAMADQYDVYYQVHAEEFGWMPWAKNGEESGTAGYAYQLEGIRVVVVEKDQAPPTALAPVIKTDKPFAEGPLAH